MSKHSPKPWRLGEVYEDRSVEAGRYIEAANGDIVAIVTHTMTQPDGSVDGYSDSPVEIVGIVNAQLIAAAPDLLAALQKCVTDSEATCLTHTGEKGHSFCLRRIQEINRIVREAIAKTDH